MTEDDPLRAGLAAAVPAAKGQDASPARTRIRATFDDITAARTRGVTWAQVAALMEADGTKAADGAVLTPDEVKALYHAERYSRGLRRKRRQPTAKGSEAKVPAPSSGGGAEAARPAPAFTPPTRARPVPAPVPAPVPGDNPVNPYAAVERHQEAKRQRQERTARLTPDSFFQISPKETE